MKALHIIAAAAVAFTAFSSSAQGLKIITKDGKTTEIAFSDLDCIKPYGEPEYVDLGLSVKWATFNVGATSPGEFGSYFMWADTDDDESIRYNKLTMPYQDPDSDPDNFQEFFLKYCNYMDMGVPDYKYTLELMDDAANVKWGVDWRMPTEEEMNELLDYCQWEKMAADDADNEYGVAGYKVTADNGNHIFLPLTGYRYITGIYGANELYYWTSSLYKSACQHGMALVEKGYGSNKTLAVDYKGRYMGYPVRPVLRTDEEKAADAEEPEVPEEPAE